ncbi:ABC transporter permease [Ornithinimicrobium pekingense]|uniref:Membrane protein n=1 Tax=Ornithinimicrobium pekingense TaxID=384677 RepID=A0ABQ2FDB5_9MICO|nr:ABC transporter permease [Ornithinimicrobium pekingense]GGK78114.1 membrane protein [Ornithinimicrobium pekingense]
MLTVTLKGMLARKLRLLLSAVSVVLGVAFVTASFSLGDSISGAFDDHIANANAGVDAVVMAGAADGSSPGALTPSLVGALAEVDGVTAVAGTTTGFAQLRDPGTGASPADASGAAIGWIEDDVLNPLTLVEGSAPLHRDEVVIDRASAESLGLQIGDSTRLITHAPARDVTVVGLAELGDGGISVLGIEAATAGEVWGYGDGFSEIRVRGEEGLTEAQVADAVEAALAAAPGTTGAGDGATDAAAAAAVTPSVYTGTEVTEANVAALEEQTGVITTFLLVFAGITLFVAGFLILNTISMLTAQRSRELAVLRALGASRGQLVRGVVAEAATIGVVGSLVGLAAGTGVATGLVALLSRLGLGLPETTVSLELRTVLVALVLGPVVTVIASLLPARRASAVQPVQAMREAAVPRTRRRVRATVATVLTLLAVTASVLGVREVSTPLVGAGAVSMVLAAVVWGPLLVGPATRVLARPFVRLAGRPTRLAEGNVIRTPHRSAATSAALVVGVALVSATAVIGSSMSGMAESEIKGSLDADVVVWSMGGMPFGGEAAGAVAGQDGVEEVGAVKIAEADVAVGASAPATEMVSAMDPALAHDMLHLRMVEGSTADLADGRVLAVEGEAGLGDSVSVTVPGAAPLELTVSGLYEGTPALGTYLVTAADLAGIAPQAADVYLLATAEEGTTGEELQATLDAYLVDAFPLLQAMTMDGFVEANRSVVDQAVTMISALLGLSLLVALLGVANTLGLSVIERTREIGMLRSIGMSRRQVRSMVRVEAVLMATYGALLGGALGLVLGRTVSAVLMDGIDLPVSVPAGRLALYVGVAVVAAVVAATLPARRAARLDVLDAVSAT